MQAEIPVEVAYVPAAKPIRLVEADTLDVVRYEAAAHAVHAELPVKGQILTRCTADTDAPVDVKYEPAAHAVHAAVSVELAY